MTRIGFAVNVSVWIEEKALFNSYKLLQFFDTLALYFHTTHTEARKEAKFLNVPDGKDNDLTLTINPREDGSYVLSPWVFDGDSIEVHAEGRYITPQPQGADFKSIFDKMIKILIYQ